VDLRFRGWLRPDARRPPVGSALPLWFSGRARCWVVVGSDGAWSVDGGVQVGPGRFPGPVLGKVQGQPAGAAGQPGRDVDQVSADGVGGGAGVKRAGQCAGGAGEVVRDRPQHRPRRVRGERSRREVGQGAGGAIGDDLLDDGVSTMLGLGLHHLEGLVMSTA
jgi:hypothetical protein